MIPSKKLETLVVNALKAKLKFDAAEVTYKEAQKAAMLQLIAEDMFNPDTKAIGPVKLGITPNRFFDLDTAITLVTEAVVKECTVEIVEPSLLKDNMTKKQIEASMKSYEVPYKLGFKVND